MKNQFLSKRWLLFTLILPALLISGCPAYRYYREALALRQAKRFAAEGDFRNASLSARRALQLNSRNVEACRILGRLAEISESPEALDWYSRVVELKPTPEDKLALVAQVLRYQEPPYTLATQMLEGIANSATNSVSYCVLSAELALKLGRGARAEAWFEAARRLQPSNELHQLNLASLRLNSTNSRVAHEARATLNRLRANELFSALALRSLVADAITQEDLEEAERYSGELQVKPQAILEDRLQHLTLLFTLKRSAELEIFLGTVQKLAATNALAMNAVSGWMANYGMAASALNWLTNASPAMLQSPSVRLAIADCFFRLGDWPNAAKSLNESKWGDLESMRLALLSRADSEQHNQSGADLYWRLAVNRAQHRLGSLMWLATKAGEWGRKDARLEVLWQIAQQFPKARWALSELAETAQARGKTRDLYRVYCRMATDEPNNPVLENNIATLRLLLGIETERAHQTASELFSQHPTEPFIASTYAYSLHLSGHTRVALTVMEQLPETELANPAIALYYGVLLRADGQIQRAGKFLNLARGEVCLPEERELLETALER